MDYSSLMDMNNFSMWDAWPAGLAYPPTSLAPSAAFSPYSTAAAAAAYQTPAALPVAPVLPPPPPPSPPAAVAVAGAPQGTPANLTQFSSLSPSEQAALLKQLGIDASQVASPALIQQYQQSLQGQQYQQQYQQQQQQQPQQQLQYVPQQHQAVAAAPVAVQQPQQQYDHIQTLAQSQQPQQQVAGVPEAPPHYSNRYQANDQQPQAAAKSRDEYVYHPEYSKQAQPQQQQQQQQPRRIEPVEPPRRYKRLDRVYYPPRQATLDELLDFLPPCAGVYQARSSKPRLSPLSRDLVYSKPVPRRRPSSYDNDDYDYADDADYDMQTRCIRRRYASAGPKSRCKSYDDCVCGTKSYAYVSDEDDSLYSTDDYSDY